MNSKVVIITGPTATGKTALSVNLCRKFSGQLLSADSRQVFKGLDVGTGKDLDEFSGSPEVKYHLIDLAAPDADFSLFDWRAHYIKSLKEVRNQNKLPIVCGGTPLYLDMLLRNYELKGKKRKPRNDFQDIPISDLVQRLAKRFPEILKKTDTTQKSRVIRALEIAENLHQSAEDLPAADYLVLGVYYTRETVRERIKVRLGRRWESLKAEVEGLLKRGLTHERLDWFGLEYRYLSKFLNGELTEKEAYEQLLIKIRQFAKRQDIWFRKIEKSGTVIHWLSSEDKLAQAESLIEKFLQGRKLPEPDLRLADTTYGPRTQ